MRSFTIVSVVLVILLFSGISFAALPIAENISITGYLSTDNLSASWDVYDGDSDDVRNFTVWSLNGDELPVLYVPFEGSSNAYNATDYAGGDNSGSSVSGAIFNSSGGYDGYGAYEFSTANDVVFLDTTNFPTIGSGNYSLMAWIKTAGTQDNYAAIFAINGYDPGFYLYSNNRLSVYDSTNYVSTINASLVDGNWHHVAFVREGTAAGQLKFYLDGRSLGTGTHGYSVNAPSTIRVGSDGLNGEDFYGSIDEVRFYDSALSAEQVAAIANNESNKIVSSMTTDDQNWSICVTPNDGTQDGTANCTDNVTIGALPFDPVSGCMEISTPGEYGLINNLAGANISGDGTSCLKITASGVTLNCYDYKIVNNGTGGTTNGILVTTDNVEIINCSVVSEYTNGIKITDSDNVSVDPSSFCNNDVGIFVNQSNNTNIVDAIACNNSQYGILVYDSINTTINDTRLYNNSLDFNINTSSSSPSIPIELNNVTFDNPSGDLNNYTILDIDDTLTISNEEYNINWSSSPSAAPNSLTNIRDGYITITATSTMSIDSAVWHWTTSEGSAFKESTIELYGWNGSDWDGAGESRNVVQNTLTVTNLANESIYGMFGDQNLFGCVELNESGSYYLGADISASSVLSYDGYQAPFGNVSSTLQGAAFDITYACIIINASNVNFDCQGLEIDWDGSGDFNSVSAGIAVVPSKNNITITNCPNIEDFAFNVYLLGNRNVHIENVSSNRSYYGLTSMRTRFSSSDCDNHTYVNVSSYNAGYTKPDWQPGAGLFSIGCINSNYINSTAYSSGSISSSVGIGMRLRDPRNISVNNLTLYNNDYDLNIRQKDIINSNVSMLSLYFLPPTGVFENYTWLDLNDSMPSDADQYSISWWNHPAVSPPLENYSLGQKFVRFRRTESLNTPTIEKLVWHYTDAEVTSESFNETTLKVYSWNTSSSWDDKGATLNFGSNKLTLNNHPVPSGLNGVVYGILGEQLAIPVSSCMEIDQPREYRLINNLAGSPINASPRTGFACLKILADDVVLDCNGYNLSHTAEIYRYAILGTGVSNLTIKNCNAYGYAYGVMLDNTSNSTMRNNYVQNPYDAGFLTDENSHNNTIVDNEVRRTSGTGDYGYRIRGDFVHMYNNTAYFPIGVYADAGLHGIYGNNTFNWSIDGYGFYPRYSYYNIVENNTFHRFDYGVYSWGGNSNNYTNNSIYDNQNVGIFLTSGSLLNRIWENNISNSGTYGIMATSSSKGNVLTNNTITDVNTAIRLDTDADFNEVYDHVIDDVTNTGIYVGDSTSYNNLIMNNNVTGIPTGISVIGAASTRIINNNVTRSSTYGIYVSQGPGTNLSKNHMYNNSRDVALYATSAPAIFMDEMIFDNPLGNYQNYSNISMYDQMSATSRYYFNWTTNSSNPPFVFPSFNEKYVDISSDIGTVSIDSISFQWNDAEVSGYSEGNLEIWKNNGSWTKMISNLNTATNNLSITNLVPNSEYGIFEGLGTGCEDITVPGTYLLGFDAYGAPFSVPDVNYVDYTCFRIMANHVRFDCNGYAITNLNHMDDAAAITIYGNTTADYTNVTIENCGNISDYEIGIALHQTSGDTIRNVTLINASGDIAQSYGIWTYNTSDSQFYNLTVRNSSWDGIRTGSGTNNTFHDNHLYDNYRYGLYTAGGSNFSIYDNNMSNNGDSGLAHNNPSSRIYSNLLEANDGVGMNVQSAGNNISDNIVRHSTGSGYYIIGNSNNLTNNTAFNNTVSGFQISYTSNVIISNCTANKNGYGLSLSSQYNLTIEDVHLFNNTKDFYIMASSGGTDYYVAKNMTIDRDAGDFNRDTHLYINDTLTEFDETYTIDHAFQPTTLPPFRATFDNKYVNITQVNGDVSINNITWKWEDSEIGSADEAELEIWKYNGSWSNTGAALNTGANSLSLSAMDPQSTYAMLEDISSLGSTPVYGCIEISDPGTYTIANGIDAASFVLYGDYTAPDGNISPVLQGNAYNIDYACILINSSNVVLNCNGSYIDWPTGPQLADTAAIALVPGSDNVIIQNCSLISDFEYGIYSLGSDAVEVSNVTINHTQHGFFSARTKFSSNDCQNNIFANSNVSDGGFGGPDYEPGSGINYIGCHESTIENVTVSKTGTGGINHGYGVILDETYNATLANVILYDNDKDLVVDPGSFTDVSLNATNLYFMWDGGTPAQYVRLDLEDNFEDLTASSPYAITGTNISESALPAWARSFENKYLDIEYLRTKATGQEINSTTWHWTSTEVASGPYVESRFDMYVSKWISSILYVQELNLVPNTTDNYMKLEHFSPEGIYGLMEDPELITGCMDITSSGRYRLANDIVGTQVAKNKCIEILADDVVIDMNGHYIVQTFVDAGTGFGIFNRGYDGTKIYGSDGHIVGYEFGMLFDTSTGVDIDPLYLCNNTIGLLVNNSNDTIINDTIACNNSEIGIYILDSDNTTIYDSRTFNNTIDLKINNTLGTPITLNMLSLIFDRPAGDNTSFTNMTINDSIAAGESYQINWSTTPSPLPGGYSSFKNKFVDVSNLTSSVSIDEIIWRWNETEITGADNESAFELWKYNGSWSNTSATLDNGNNTLTLTNMNPASDYGILQSSVSTCMLITSPGDYVLTSNVEGAPYNMLGITSGASNACIGIASSNVTFDCDGYNITNNGTTNAAGIIINSSLSYPNLLYDNVTIQNCPAISGYDDGIVLDQVNTTTVSNSTAFNNSNTGILLNGRSSAPYNYVVLDYVDIHNNSDGFIAYFGSHVNITNSRAWNNSNAGVKLENEYVEIELNNYTAWDNTYGVHLTGPFSSGTEPWANVYNSEFYNNSYGFYGLGTEGPDVPLGNITIANTTFYENAIGIYHGYNADLLFGFIYLEHFLTLDNVTVNSSSSIGASLYKSSVNANGLVFTNNTQDVLFNNSDDFNPMNFSLDMNMTFLNPAATYVNYTNLTLNDVLRNNESYSMTWTTNSSTLPTDYTSFEQKFINITPTLGTPTIETTTWHWTDTEAASYTEANLELWKWNGSWSDTGATLSEAANTLTLSNYDPASDYGILEGAGVSCFEINSSGSYQLTGDLVGAPNPVPSGGYACVVISASDVALDCNGYTITGNNSPAGITYGVYARGPYSNITIENCFVSSYFEASVFLHEVSDSFIINNTAYNTSFHFGFWFNQSFQDNIVENNTAYDNEAYGFYVFRDCDRNNFTGNTAYNNSWSTEFLFGGCDYNRVVNNTAPFGTGGTSGFKLDTSPYNTFIGNNVSNRGREGFENYNSRNGTFINNTVVNCQGAGFEATGTSDYLTFTNNTVQGTSTFNSASGFDIRTDHVLLEDNTVHGQPANLNSFSGSFYFNSADDIVMTNNHVYNSTPALRYAAFNGPYILNVTNLIVDNPLGNFQNYTNLSYNDSHTAVGVANYLINWSDGPGSLPTDYISFENKHVNITPVTNNISLDRIVWHWNDAELPGYNESEFELWKHNGSWSDTGATLNTGANTLSLTNMNPASEYSILERDVEELSNCPIITAPGTYTMTSDFAGAPNSASELGPSRLACVKIASSDVVFDCAGHTIHESSVSDSFYTYGVLVNGSNSQGVLRTNVTVQNCVIAEYYQGVHLRNSRTTSVINNTIANSTGPGTIHYGIQSFSTNWTGANEVTNYYAHNTITNIGAYGISSFGSGNSTFYNNTISLFNSYGISASDHLHNITDNLVRDGGNGYSAGFNIQSENATVHNNTAYNISGDGFNAGAGRDYNNFTSNHAYNNSDDGFDFSGIHGYLLEENLAHDNGGNGFYIWTMVGGSYSNISNNTAENNTLNGFHLNFEPYNTLEDNYAFNNSLNGFLLNASKYNNLTSNIALNNSQSGFMLTDDFLWGSYNTSEYNRLIDNNASGNGVAGLSVISSNHNYVDPSYFCNNTNGLIVFNSTNVTLFDNVLCNNTDYGLNMTQSNVTLSENQMYNNGHDLFVEGDTNYNMSGSLFLNPLGTLVDYTNLSINDSLAASTSYTINWTANSSTLPTDYNSFEEKFVNISTVTGTSSIGSLAWHWTDTEAGSYDESKLQVWKWNGSWSNTGAILNAGANTLTLTGMNPASDYGILENATPSSGITECILIDAAGTYQLANNLVGAPIDATELVYIDWACIKIDASDVLLDCNGYNITNNGTLNAGAIVTNATSTLDYTNITLQNCPAISDYEIGVYSQYMNSSVIRNLAVHNSTDGVQGFGFLMSYSVDTNISDNEISDSGSYGIRLRTGQRNRITNNIIYGSGYTGFEIGSTNGYVINNTAHSNDADGYNFISGGYNLIENNLAYNNTDSGFDTNTDNSLFLNNTARDNDDGFSIGGSYNTNFTNCTAYRSDRYGLYTSEADEIRLENFHFYDNGYDLYWYAYGGVEDLYATNLTFDNPVGDFDDYTRIDFNASLDANSDDLEVSFNWTTNSSALPTNYTSFAQKFINITPQYGDISIDEISWRWSDSELGFIYDESSFELWKWNGSWSDTGATLNTGENSLSLTNMNPASDYGILQNGSIGENATLYAAEVNETKHERYNESSYAGNASTAGGNFTNMNLSAGQLSERWAALYGTFDGSILLSDSVGINNVYSWIWNASAGGVVCVSTNDSLFTFTVFPAEASDIDTAWSFSPTAADSANNTFTQSNCTLDIGTTSVPNASYADTGLEGGYITCAIKTTLSPVKSNLAFCAEIEEDGPIWNGDSGDFEIIVPTPTGVGTTETYYFYVNLD